MSRALQVAVLHPLLTVSCGDEANAAVLRWRGAQRGLEVTVREVCGEDQVPRADLYLLGGGAQRGIARLVDRLGRTPMLERAVAEGAAVFAVDAGIDALGRGVVDPGGLEVVEAGLGLIDLVSERGPRRDGDVATVADPALGLPAMSGWVDHDVRVRLGAGVRPLVALALGTGDGGATDGFLHGRLIGTRLHGPVLARNPELADLVLATALGEDVTRWSPLPETAAERARGIRLAELRR